MAAALIATGLPGANAPLTPRLVGDWWTAAGDPDLGPLTTPKQQPVDFGIWQAGDGTWQIWSCIRGTKEPGNTRLFHRWEGAKLTDRDWTPKGIALQADPALGETRGGLQAPFVLRHDGKYWMFYGDWVNICLATSTDGKTFTRHHNAEGKPQLHFAGSVDRSRNGRDPMVLRIGHQWHLYYTAHPGNKGFDYGRTSDDLLHWSEERVVAARGKSGDGPYSAECPFVVEPRPGHFYLFRTQAYGKNAQTMVYHSRDPLDFGIDNDAEHYVTTLPVAAPEMFQHDGQWFMAALLPTLKGIQITRMEWVPAVALTESSESHAAAPQPSLAAGRSILGCINQIPPETPEAREARLKQVAARRAGTPILVHRGATRFAPENTLDAYAAAMDHGADGVEIDIRRSKDGVLYLLHDPTLERMTDQSGQASERTYVELLQCRVKGGSAATTRIPTLAALLLLARQRAMLLHLDVKEPGLQDAIERMLEAAGLWEHIVEVNAGNAERLRAHPKVRLLRYKGWLPQGGKEPDRPAIAGFLAQPGDMVFCKDDPAWAVEALGRSRPAAVPLATELFTRWPLTFPTQP